MLSLAYSSVKDISLWFGCGLTSISGEVLKSLQEFLDQERIRSLDPCWAATEIARKILHLCSNIFLVWELWIMTEAIFFLVLDVLSLGVLSFHQLCLKSWLSLSRWQEAYPFSKIKVTRRSLVWEVSLFDFTSSAVDFEPLCLLRLLFTEA